jgi:hypothetical protein
MKEYEPEVKIGQLWTDNDPRYDGQRSITVVKINGITATCKVISNLNASVGKIVKIRLDRFKPTKTGYTLIKEGGEGK